MNIREKIDKYLKLTDPLEPPHGRYRSVLFNFADWLENEHDWECISPGKPSGQQTQTAEDYHNKLISYLDSAISKRGPDDFVTVFCRNIKHYAETELRGR